LWNFGIISVVVVPSPQPLSYAQNQTGAANVVSDDGVRKLVAADNISATSINPSTSLIQQSSVGMNSNASEYILHRGIIVPRYAIDRVGCCVVLTSYVILSKMPLLFTGLELSEFPQNISFDSEELVF
jgi:hypothetical protein